MKQRKRIGELMVEVGLITPGQLQHALAVQAKQKGRLGDVLLSEGLITEEQLIQVLDYQLGIPHVQLYRHPIEQEIIDLISQRLAEQYRVLPLRIEDSKLIVAMEDPLDYYALEELRLATGYRIEPVIATREELGRMIRRYYGMQESVDEMLQHLQQYEEETLSAQLEDEQSPVVKTVNQLITQAVTVRASDIHLDPQGEELAIRYRVDGVLRTERALPKHMQSVIVARIKILANLNLTERRLPQDGRFEWLHAHEQWDVRVSTLPTIHGEKVVMRLLNQHHGISGLDQLGFTPHNLAQFQRAIQSTYGIILLTGPTGSGKSTTLYAALSQLYHEGINVMTIEDPVEYQLPGINQVQVNAAIGMTFARGLRAMLRQDPNIIMVGEIRDLETAEIAVRAAMTGHLVLSTLHTNSAVNAMTRLMDMGVEPYLVSSSLLCVAGQRLVRRVCTQCAQPFEPAIEERMWLERYRLPLDGLRRGAGCEACGRTGFRGRLAIHEVLTMDDELRLLTMNKRPDSEYRAAAAAQNFATLFEDGLRKAAEGLTTISEVLRVATPEEEDRKERSAVVP
ncbi:type II/IV secretion system protein [Paenibacillus dendritiformis]|uniref:GspE/PulE family protein n=1 Tax=Paenibacillus dendritiformis TaxID=130049 RepID=UPI00143D74B2|nr:GspE/PulE family protein [Paenibacillus dendritiformis]NKI20414.1 type II/IV secretion system protein [Paenibacillus dendritiformis]NRF98827.1 type II/IV secretion system protein [Paenibacillus dendritiformis]